MENKQINKLKLNANNIKNTLFKSNKELILIKKDRLKLSFQEQEKKKLFKKESNLESKSSFLQSVKNVGQKLISGPLSLIDKFKEFFGLILLGIVVNNLPAIVKKLQDVFVKIQTFLDQNPWIMKSVKFGFEMIGKGIMGLAKVIKFIEPYIGGSFKFALDTLKSVRVKVESLITTFDDLNLSFDKLAKDLNVDKIPDVNKDPVGYSNFVAGGGKTALKQKGQTVDEVVEQGKKNISSYNSGSRSPTQKIPQQGYNPYQQPQPPQKFARGGTVGNIPPQEGTFRGGPSDVAKTKLSTPTTNRSPFTKTESGTARKARQSVNYFETFNKTLNDVKDNTILEEKNIKNFEKMTFNFKEFSRLMEKFSSLSSPPISPEGDNPIIEFDGNTYIAEGGESPTQHLSSPFGYRNINLPGASKYHQGVDFAYPTENIPISVLQPGTVLSAGPNDGLGNYVEILHNNGSVTGYGHLSRILVTKDQVVSPGTVIGNQGSTGTSSAPHVHFTYRRTKGGALENGLNVANSYFRFGGNVKIKELSFSGANGEEKVWNFFKSPGLGLSDAAIAGIMGNAQQESGFNPTIAHSERLQGKPAKFIGIFQWGNVGNGDRWGDLVRWAKDKKLNPESIDTQLKWTMVELNGSYSSVIPRLKAAKTPEEAAEIWYNHFEGASHGLTNRKNFAKQFYKKYKGKQPPPPSAAPPSQTPAPPSQTPPRPNPGGAYAVSEEIIKDTLEDRPKSISLLPTNKDLIDLSDSSHNWESTSNIIFQPIVYEKLYSYPIPIG